MQKLYHLPIIKTIVYANVFISLCAMAQLLVTYMVFPIPINFKNNSFIFFVLLSTYLQYNMQRGYMIQQQNLLSERSHWVTYHKKILLVTVGLCLITVLFLCNSLSYTSIGIMVGAEILSTVYYLPPFNFRKHGYIKPFLISLVWVISCVAVPLLENNLLTPQSIWFMLSQFLFVTSLCVLFDIKDADDDYMNGVNTYANKFGIKATKLFTIVLLCGFLICSWLFKQEMNFQFLTSIVLAIVAIGCIALINEKRHSFFYYLWIDGLLILQAVLYFVFSKTIFDCC